ncbi:MAG: carbohydrate porin [Lautropia sp.]
MRHLASAAFCTMLVPQAGMAQIEVDTGALNGAEAVFEGSISGVLQRLNRGGSDSGNRESRANYRGDLSAALPVAGIGKGAGHLFGHVRFGQGAGVSTRPTYTGSINSLAFETSTGSDSFAILAQLYYQLSLPISSGPDSGRKRVELNLGKIDPFLLFDQNKGADDEASRFLNNVFVHNPLLDSGGDLGADRYGFTPGVRAAYFDDENARFGWSASIGVFGAGANADFGRSLGKPFVIAQIQLAAKRPDGDTAGNYRLYRWSNPQADNFDQPLRPHAGWGISLDQAVGNEWMLFGRYGRRTTGHGTFDRAITVGFVLAGNRWGRPLDGLGMAIGRLSTDAWYRAATADGSLVGYSASGHERVMEVYYGYAVNRQFEISPHLQIVSRPGGDGSAPALRALGLRASLGF